MEFFSNRDSVCISWVIFPGVELLPYQFLAIVYFFALIYLFLGVAIVADSFMEAIEVITSQTRKVKHKDKNGKTRYYKV